MELYGKAPSPALLLTATIDPRGMPMTLRTDPSVRMNDYKSALVKWRAAIDAPIIFCENSGADLSPLQDALGADADRVEWLSFEAPPFPARRGKSYGEALIVRHALDHSAVLENSSHLVKMTGRVFVSNASRLWRELPDIDVSCDLCPYRLVVTESRLFSATPQFVRDYFLPETELIDEGAVPIVHFERALGRAILRAIADGRRWRPLPITPFYVGVSGSLGSRYHNRDYLLRDAVRRYKAWKVSRLSE